MSRKVFITGVSSGLGWGLARQYLSEGAIVHGCSRREPADLAEGFPGRLVFRSVDLSREAEARAAVEELLVEAGAIDVAVLNAGILPEVRDLRDTPLATLREVMEVNVWSNKWLIDLLASRREPVRQVVAISSGAAVSGMRGWNAYSVSKAALNMLVKLYAAELPEIHFTAFAPGLIDSAMQDYLTGLPPDERFPPLEKLRRAKGTEAMPGPEEAGRRVAAAIPRLLKYPSGDYVDIRNM
ncbi:MAG: SDR family NAD(P)-dependent oxidoreductase [Puniceicoccaceae bacterium]|nr:MAG: SDR family NAD(P)-dependent oxidoreductase [Puniceicoccaceae bacterium]